ncbi:MAG: serine hydrolase domain-containing protein [Candidatus Hydrogenedentes bacterium]|nr:serine hydrolase domain-containing protein [Candidatus Hydrogenedentota bacterium]
MTKGTTREFQRMISRAVDGRSVFGCCVRMTRGDGSQDWSGAAGDLDVDTQYFIASTTKLYTTAIILSLQNEGALALDEPVSRYLDSAAVSGIHVYRGVDYSQAITIAQLLAHTSGLPDYFQQRVNGRSLLAALTKGEDQHWTFEDVVEKTRAMPPKFAPGTKGRALYADTNYQILGKIIETICGKSFSSVLHERIFEPLGLNQTYLFTDADDTRPRTLYYKHTPLRIPEAMASFGPDGGIVSTANETLRFLRAFFTGELFPENALEPLKTYNRIFFPLEYGIGFMRFKLPWIFSPFRPLPELLGHSGLSGAFAFYCPEKDLYVAGTVNQIAKPRLPYRLMMNMVMKG